MKKTFVKGFLSLATCIAAALVLVLAAACAPQKEPVKASEDAVAIEVVDESFNGKTLKEYMDKLVADKKLEFTFEGGMVKSINGKANTTGSFWMLYTSDEENANTTWGILEYEGKTYGSALYGADKLTIKVGCLYVWSYQTF